MGPLQCINSLPACGRLAPSLQARPNGAKAAACGHPSTLSQQTARPANKLCKLMPPPPPPIHPLPEAGPVEGGRMENKTNHCQYELDANWPNAWPKSPLNCLQERFWARFWACLGGGREGSGGGQSLHCALDHCQLNA